MNAALMLYEFRIAFDSIASGAAPGFTDTEIYSLLNKAEDYVVLESYKTNQLNNLYTIIKNYNGTIAGSSGLYTSTMPTDFWLFLQSFSTITRTGFTNSGFVPTQAFTGRTVENIPIEAKDAYKYIRSAFNDSKVYKQPYSYFETNTFYVISDGYTTVTDIQIKYIKERTAIDGSNNSELPEAMHRIIVDQAVKFAQESVFSQLPNKQ